MNAIFLFEAKRNIKHWPGYLILLILVFIGTFCGNQFNLSVGQGIYLNSPYTIGFMTGMLSLSIIFFATVYALQLLFKDDDTRFSIVLFSLPISKLMYLKGKFLPYFLQTFLSFFALMTGFMIGQMMRTGSEMQDGFNGIAYLYPIVLFGLINSLLVCSFLFFISLILQKKLLVAVGGLFLYIFYMIVLLFSNSPFMAGSIPQSLEGQQLSALIDPFGLSSYFLQAREFSVHQKNVQIVPFSGYVLLNRLSFFILSVGLLFLSYRLFSFSYISKQKVKKNATVKDSISQVIISEYIAVSPNLRQIASVKSILSFVKIDLIYLFKSITVPAASILLLFFVGMEMYAEIEKGIRLPQKYAGSGLMATTISENFHLFGLLIVAYFLNDLYWRSQLSGFFVIEKTAFFSKNKLSGHFISINILLFFFTVILIIQGIIFQIGYQYFHIDWNAYLAVFLFNTFPLILFSGFILLINDNIRNKFIALGISVLAVLVLTGPVSNKVLPYPLFRIFSDFKGSYSDFNRYGVYTTAFAQRLLFGAGVIALLWILSKVIKTKKISLIPALFTLFLLTSGIYAGTYFMKGYLPRNEEKVLMNLAQYEKNYRKYNNLPQPEINEVITDIRLFPSDNSYQIVGKYKLKNQTDQLITKVLVNFNNDLELKSAVFTSSSETTKINTHVTEIILKQPMLPGETAFLDFKLSYKWYPVNGHQSFNAIIENGSFMRISRYYPTIGYQKVNEIQDQKQRDNFRLGKAEMLKKPEAPEVFRKDFINLDMTISTEGHQTAIGTGDLIMSWTKTGRNFFRYKATGIPFRFAVSSAEYSVKSTIYKGIPIHIFYQKKHFENVNHLLENAKLTLDYCRQNFGQYPFKAINFVEISSFTRGFAATAYPSAIFMPEDMVFHANIHADKKQDVINELAGHELSHLWWGNSQIDPDDREGAVMLTETLAMYTEMMLYKKMHGKEKMLERIAVHQQIYDNEKGLSENRPIYKATGDDPHISYSKGAVAMVRLSDLLGEEKVNKALNHFLQNNSYPKKPTSLDLINELYKVSPNLNTKKQIDLLFKTTENIAVANKSKSASTKEKTDNSTGSF
ncbi:aminopeptidase [Chryseobacterium lactis]|uniref:Aminopeptidase n=1 Tax=Chryseobacterium lactis TaxID=1241981 RepID=A0A3G6RDH3_CHRLC|nr:M1 family aminopeptidase [Chryseobacterium lactis]AZA82759.1 aminopeptidase [Chryseobacterium lactis]AZB03141.1 aminopeptidase [Chryseobacterium lactis]PNW11210.1 aminopeptidase [Chryseobacterium lactis]